MSSMHVKADIESKSIAKINSTYITEHDLQEAIEITSILNNIPQEQLEKEKQTILKDLLTKDILIIDQGAKLNIKPSDEEVTSAIDSILKGAPFKEEELKKISASDFMHNKIKAEIVSSKILNSLRSKIDVSSIDISSYASKVKIIDKIKLLMIAIEESNIEKFGQAIRDNKMPRECKPAESYIKSEMIADANIIEPNFNELNQFMQKLIEETPVGEFTNPLAAQDENNKMASIILICKKTMKNGKDIPMAELKNEIIEKKLGQSWHKYLNMLKKQAFIEYYNDRN
jgi:hypothetical protein